MYLIMYGSILEVQNRSVLSVMAYITMFVLKRNGVREEVSFDRILERIKKLSEGLDHVNPALVAQKVCSQIEDGITTARLDEFAAETCAMMQARNHPNYGVIAARIVIDNHQKKTPPTFAECVSLLYEEGVVSEKLFRVSFDPEIQEMIVDSRDYMFDYFGFKTLEKGYLLKKKGLIIERPQYMWMRVAIEIHTNDQYIPDHHKIKQTYDGLSQGYFIHATPTLFNAGTGLPQLSSCFLLQMKDDSIKGIYDSLSDCAQISKWSGGIGLSIHNIRAKNSRIKGTNGKTSGIVPMLKVYNDTARYVNQAGKRNGSFAIYLEPWHADIEDFMRLKLNTGAEEDRARDLFYALWIPDLFMKRMEQNQDWSLFCPNECPGLSDCSGETFEKLYTKYESEGKARKVVSSQKLWTMILDAQIQTGTPYLLYKDAANTKSNQQHLGTIKSSNLCAEIVEYTAPNETAVCNLGSVALSKFVKEDKTFDFDGLRYYTSILADNLDLVIDRNYYPTPECSYSNFRNRPIGIGVQGLADVFAKMGIPWSSEAARDLNREIFENMYYAAIAKSMNLSVGTGKNKNHKGSPASEGKLQYHLWGEKPTKTPYLLWDLLEWGVKTNGLRNSLSIALMPTASTSQILGNNECFEPFTSNLYVRHVLAGDFIVVNKYLVDDLMKRNLWNSEMRSHIIANNGSIQDIPGIDPDIKELYKTAWEIPQKTLINMSRDRAPFVCQSQSLNLFVADPTYARISSMHVYAWKQGLKTGCYYLRTKAVASAQQFTVEPCTMCSA